MHSPVSIVKTIHFLLKNTAFRGGVCFLRLSPYKCAINLFYILHCIEQIEFTFYLYALGLPDKIQDARLNLNSGYTAESYLNFTFNWSPAFYLLNLATFRWTYPPVLHISAKWLLT